MAVEEKTPESGTPGSSETTSGPAASGQPQDSSASTGAAPAAGGGKSVDTGETVPKSVYEDLERKLGSQGEELGKYREFLQDISPLLDTLKTMPELTSAIVDGKIDVELAKAVAEGRVKLEDAATVAAAHSEVKKDMGQEKYDKATTADIEKLVESKLAEIGNKFQSKISEVEARRQFENKVSDFVENTPDFHDYADAISKWIADHPDQYDVEVAYYAVKGQLAVEDARKKAGEHAAEEAKRIAANAGGGQSQGGRLPDAKAVVDKLISSAGNPNRF